jgi:hypothetical protein
MGRSYLIFCIILLISCDNNKHPRKYRLAKESVEDNIVLEQSPLESNIGFTWDALDSWNSIDNNSFSLANYQIPHKDGFADLSITKFPGDAGGIIANVNRWRRQLQLESHSLQEINKNSRVGESKIGNFSVHRLVNDSINQAFLCAILPYEDSTIFIKLKSSALAMRSLEKIFLDFCSSFKPLD